MYNYLSCIALSYLFYNYTFDSIGFCYLLYNLLTGNPDTFNRLILYLSYEFYGISFAIFNYFALLLIKNNTGYCDKILQTTQEYGSLLADNYIYSYFKSFNYHIYTDTINSQIHQFVLNVGEYTGLSVFIQEYMEKYNDKFYEIKKKLNIGTLESKTIYTEPLNSNTDLNHNNFLETINQNEHQELKNILSTLDQLQTLTKSLETNNFDINEKTLTRAQKRKLKKMMKKNK